MPRRASAAAKSGCAFTSCSQASYSSPMIAACWPSTTWKSSRRSSLTETVASQVVSATQSTSTIAAVRATASPGACARQRRLVGLDERDRDDQRALAQRVLAAQRRHRRRHLLRGQGIERMERAGDQAWPDRTSVLCKCQGSRVPPDPRLERDMQHDELRRCENSRVNETRDVVVVGATGKLGEQVCHQLRAQGEQVRALVRGTSDPAARARLEADGVRCYEGDIEQPETLGDVFAGVGRRRLDGIRVPRSIRDPIASRASTGRASSRSSRRPRPPASSGSSSCRFRRPRRPPVPARQARGRGALALGAARARDPASARSSWTCGSRSRSASTPTTR